MTDHRGDGSVDPEYLKRLVGQIESLNADMVEQRGELGNLYKNAENDHGVNRMALKQAIKLKNMEALKRSAWLRAFESYCHILGVDAQGELALVPGDGEGEPEEGAPAEAAE